MTAMVQGVASLLIACGVPLAAGDNSKLVLVLREITEELKMKGDPRDELRRVIRQHKAQCDRTRRLIFAAVARGLSADEN